MFVIKFIRLIRSGRETSLYSVQPGIFTFSFRVNLIKIKYDIKLFNFARLIGYAVVDVDFQGVFFFILSLLFARGYGT